MPNLQGAQHPIRSLVWIGVTGLLLLGGCKKQPANNEASKAQPAPSTVAAPDQSQASAPTPAPPPPTPPSVSPETSSQPPASVPPQPPAAPESPASATPPAPSPVTYTIPRNTRVTVRLSQTLSSKHNDVGDSFRGTLAESIRVNGVIVVRYGTPVSGTVVGAKGQGKLKGSGDLSIALTRIGKDRVQTSVYEKTVPGKGKRTAGFIGGGGGGGALIGALAGGGRGALIGGLVGAGAGTAGAAYTGNKDVVISTETPVSFSLVSPLRVVLAPPPPKAAP